MRSVNALTKRSLAPLLVGVLAASAACGQTPMRMIESFPAANAIMDGRVTHFAVMFDSPLDHAASRLLVEQNGVVVKRLITRLNSQPNTLYSDGYPLPAGNYTLHWDAHGLHGGGASEGAIPFSVAPR